MDIPKQKVTWNESFEIISKLKFLVQISNLGIKTNLKRNLNTEIDRSLEFDEILTTYKMWSRILHERFFEMLYFREKILLVKC